VRRRLFEEQPEAYRADLAFLVHNLGHELQEAGRLEDAFETTEEAIRILAPFFERQPQVYDLRMRQLVRAYLTQAEAGGREPDGELIVPIARKQIELAVASGEVEMPEEDES